MCFSFIFLLDLASALVRSSIEAMKEDSVEEVSSYTLPRFSISFRLRTPGNSVLFLSFLPCWHLISAVCLPRIILFPDPSDFSRFQIVLETEYDNDAALSLYESLGFIREKRLYRFYLNGKDAFRLVLSVPPPSSPSPSGSDADDSGTSFTATGGFIGEKTHFRRTGGLGTQRYRAIRVSAYSDEEEEPPSGR